MKSQDQGEGVVSRWQPQIVLILQPSPTALVHRARLKLVIHPANSFLTHEIVAKTALGIGLDETPRWG